VLVLGFKSYFRLYPQLLPHILLFEDFFLEVVMTIE
jgi:hypothetical protein